MARVEVVYEQYLEALFESLRDPGALLVSLDTNGRPNAMTIGWAQIGIIWGLPILSVLVRPSRYTYDCLEATGEFTVCVPYEDLRAAVEVCGSRSGRDLDKLTRCGLTAEPGATVQAPGLAECGLIYECRVVNTSDFTPDRLAPQVCTSCYSSGDYHRVYYGEIMRTIADEDFDQRFAG